ncbi:MAG: nuclear transport factor 2 family protein [Terracidiphilus sp.]|jgi:ketosteroid isomerase-like protein
MPGAINNPWMIFSRRMALGLMLVPLLAQASFASPVQAGMPRSQKHESRHAIDLLEEAWRNAVLKSNIAAMDALLADDFMAITSSGTLQTKDQTLANLRSGRVHFTALDLSDSKVRFYGTTALVTSLAKVKGTAAEGDISGCYRYTRVYVRDARGKWKIVSFEASMIRQDDEQK